MMHSPGFDGSGSLSLQMLMNADSLYTAAHCALLLNLKLSHGDYYRKRPTLAPGMMVSVRSPSDPPRTGGWRAGHQCPGRDALWVLSPTSVEWGSVCGAVEGGRGYGAIGIVRWATQLPTLLWEGRTHVPGSGCPPMA